MVSVQQHQKVFVAHLPAAFVTLFKPLSSEKHSQAASGRITPFVLSHLIATEIEPEHVFYVCALDGTPLKKTPAPEYRMPLAKSHHPLDKGQQVTICRLQIPIQPTDLIVLAIGIVVSLLGMTDRISR